LFWSLKSDLRDNDKLCDDKGHMGANKDHAETSLVFSVCYL